MEDEFPDATVDELVEHCVPAKVRRQTFDGYSPLQWWFGTQCTREVEEHGNHTVKASWQAKRTKRLCGNSAQNRKSSGSSGRGPSSRAGRIML